jgi:hypothetical protein
VELAVAELERNPLTVPKPPAYPDYHKGTPLGNHRQVSAGGGK